MKRTSLMILTIGLFALGQSAQAQWQATKRITWTSGRSESPAIAVDPSGNPHVVWIEPAPGVAHEIFYKKSTDGGAAWTPAKRLTWSSGSIGLPDVAIDSAGNLHVVYHGRSSSGTTEIFHKMSSDGGSTWTTGKRLTWSSIASSSPVLAVVSSNVLYTVWIQRTEAGSSEIYFKKSTDAGATWTKAKRLTWTSGFSANQAIAVDPSGNPHIVWVEFLGAWPYNREAFYKRSSDGGTAWTANKRLTWKSGYSASPHIFVDNFGNVRVVWSEEMSEDNNCEIYYKKSPDGTAWTANKRLTWTPSISLYPGVAADPAGNVYVVWEEELDHTEIYYKKSTNGGSVWSRTWNVSWTSGDSYEPDVALDSSGHLHVVWYDSTPGNFEIYYKKRE